MSKLVGIYLRISQDREGLELGVTRQDEDCTALCERLGDVIVDRYMDDDIGASTRSRKKRDNYDRLIKDARSGRIDKIVAYTSSRLTRRPLELEGQIKLAERYKVEFGYVASPSFDLNTAAGRQIARHMAAADAGVVEGTAELIVRQNEQAAAEGLYRGGPRPFGWDADGVTLRENEAELIKEMAERVLAGETLGSIAASLNSRGAVTSRNVPWRVDGITQVLNRGRNAGLSVRHGEVVGIGVWPAILEESTWRAVVAHISDPSRRTASSNALKHIGAGLYLCGRCEDGTTMRTCRVQSGYAIKMPRGAKRRTAEEKKRKSKRGYRCSKIDHLSRTAEPVDALVNAAVIKRLSQPDAIDLLRDDSREDLDPLRLRLNTVRAKLDELVDLHREDQIDGRQLTLGTKKLRDEKLEIEGRLAAAAATSVLVGLVGAADVRAAWEATPPSRRQAVIADLMTVTFLPGGTGRRPGGKYFDPKEVRIDWKR